MKISKSESSKKKITVKSSKTADKKQSVKASEDIAIVEVAPEVVEVCEPECVVCKYEDAINLIGAAIESLAQIAKDDEIAKDSIANLGVVMLDLKGECK